MVSRIKSHWRKCLWGLVAVLAISVAGAETSHTSNLRVGIVEVSPFSQKNDQAYQGVVIDIWEAMAREYHWRFHYVSAGSDSQRAIQQLAQGKYDVLLGPLSVTASRLQQVDFTRPFFINNIGIVVLKKRLSLRAISAILFEHGFFSVMGGFLLSFLLYLHLLWYFERGKHDTLPMSYREALSGALWVHIFKKGFPNMPQTLQGKWVLLLWVLAVAVLFTSLNASVTSSLTVAFAQGSGHLTLSDLQQQRVIGVDESGGALATARSQGLYVTAVQTPEEGLALLQSGQADAMIFSTEKADAYLKTHQLQSVFVLSDLILGHDEYAFALPYGSPLRKTMDMSIAAYQDDQSMLFYCQKYLGSQAKGCEI